MIRKIKEAFNNYSKNRLKTLEENDRKRRGVVLNKFGQEVIESKLTFKGYGVHSNVVEWGWQPRALEIQKLISPILNTPYDDLFSLNENTGDVYLSSEVKEKGDNAKPLLQIDLDVEKKLFEFVAKNMMMRKAFKDVSYKNPVCVDTTTGRIYPKNNPSETRGKVNFGPTVHGPASGRRR